MNERIAELEQKRVQHQEAGRDVPLELAQAIAVLREQIGEQPHFGGTMPHRWEWWNLHPEGRLRICVYCAIVREIDDDSVVLPLDPSLSAG